MRNEIKVKQLVIERKCREVVLQFLPFPQAMMKVKVKYCGKITTETKWKTLLMLKD